MVRTIQKAPALSVIICHHTQRLIDRCLASLRTTQGITYEVCVITSDATYDGPDEVRTVYEAGGPAHKRNIGTRLAAADLLVFLDDDIEVGPYTLYELWRNMEERPHAGMGFCKILNMERRGEFDDCGSWLTWTGFLWARAGNHQVERYQYDQACRILSSKSATCIIRRETFIRIGGFDAGYYILGEETDLAWRVWLSGLEVWYFPSARSWHAFGTSLKPKADYYTLERIHFHGCKNYLNLLLTNLGLWRLLWMFPIHILAWCVSAGGFALRGEWRRSWLILNGMWWNITHWSSTNQKRRKVQSSRVVGDAVLLKQIGANPPITYYINRLKRYVLQGLHG